MAILHMLSVPTSHPVRWEGVFQWDKRTMFHVALKARYLTNGSAFAGLA